MYQPDKNVESSRNIGSILQIRKWEKIMISKSKIISMVELLNIGCGYKGYHLLEWLQLDILTDADKQFSLKTDMNVEIFDSEDECNYIEYEYDENAIKNAINNILNNHIIKLFITKYVRDNMKIFVSNINYGYTLEGYTIEVVKEEGVLSDSTNIKCKKQLYIN